MGTEETLLSGLGLRLRESPGEGPPGPFECVDLEVRTAAGELLYAGPRYFRCTRPECLTLVTHGMVKTGGCWCGNRRLMVALKLTVQERDHLLAGYYPLVAWEIEHLRPVVPEDTPLGWGKQEWDRQYA